MVNRSLLASLSNAAAVAAARIDSSYSAASHRGRFLGNLGIWGVACDREGRREASKSSLLVQ
jgi:hypothetical protein